MDAKTNVIRLLDSKKIAYKVYLADLDPYENTAEDFASYVGVSPDIMFKTLVTVAKSNKNYVFVAPSTKELDLKKCAKAVNEKAIEMVKVKDLLALTGYVHGGCSPLMMKKPFKTVFDLSAKEKDCIVINAGKVGTLVELKVCDLQKIMSLAFCDIVNA